MSTLEEAFAKHMDESLQPEGIAAVENFRINDDVAADWALRKLAVIEKRMTDARALGNEEIRRVAEWLEEERERYERDRAWFVKQLEDYQRRVLAEDKRRKTIALPAGTLQARKKPDNVEIENDDAFVEWAAKERTDLVRTKHEIDKPAVKQAVLKDGEVLPGVKRVEGEVSYRQEVKL